MKERIIGYRFPQSDLREVFLNNAGGVSIQGVDDDGDPIVISMTFDQARELAGRLKSLSGNRASSSTINLEENK